MPSVQKHGLSAVLLLALFALSSFTWLQFYKNNNALPSLSGPEYKLEGATPTANASLHANPNEGETLPDLLNGDNIPLNVNPTESLDLLGGPKQEAVAPPNGPRPPVPSVSTTRNAQPKTIVINDQSMTLNTQFNQAPPLIKAPIAGLSRITPFGRVPHRKPNRKSAAHVYARPFVPQNDTQYIAVIVGGLGINSTLTQKAIFELPAAVSLSFAAHAPNLQNWIDQARDHGHEVLLEIPMQEKQSEIIDPSSTTAKYSLRSDVNDGDNIKSIDYQLSRAEGYFAVTNYGGAALVNQTQKLTPIINHFNNAGIGFIYDGEITSPKIETISKQISLPYTASNSYLDDVDHTAQSVTSELTNLAASAAKSSDNNDALSIPLGMAFSYEGSLDGILNWYANKPLTVELAPASYQMLRTAVDTPSSQNTP